MSIRLTFVGGGEGPSTDYSRGTFDVPMPGSRPRPASFIDGDSASQVLGRWNASPWWATYGPQEFRQRIVSFCGADDPKYVAEPIELPASDERILDAVVEAAGPDGLRLQTFEWESELENWDWTFAKTMRHIPHWYVVREKTISAGEFDAFADHIQTQGYRAIWTSPGGHRVENTYLEISDWKYWRIGVVINRDRLGVSTVEKIS